MTEVTLGNIERRAKLTWVYQMFGRSDDIRCTVEYRGPNNTFRNVTSVKLTDDELLIYKLIFAK